MKNIFLIGPASVGKSTIGTLLSQKLGWDFIDIDLEFCGRIALIPDYIKSHDYATYSKTNSDLARTLVSENPTNTVFATPSGFLVHEDLPQIVERNLELIKDHVSVLLLPGKDSQKYVDTIVQRQLDRWNDCDAKKEGERFLERFEKYKQYGDIQVFSNEPPDIIVEKVMDELKNLR